MLLNKHETFIKTTFNTNKLLLLSDHNIYYFYFSGTWFYIFLLEHYNDNLKIDKL